MMENDLKRVLNIEDEFDLFLIKVSDLNEIEFVAERVEDALRKDRRQKPGEEDFTVNTPLESLQSIKTILTSINIVILSIAGIALFVGGVGITNTMYTSVLERTREIGVMKAVGARNSNILSLFLIESGFLGLVGGIIGALFGLSFAFLAAFGVASAFPGINFGVEISYSLLFGAIGFSFVVGTISGILPAIQASQLKPVDALRK